MWDFFFYQQGTECPNLLTGEKYTNPFLKTMKFNNRMINKQVKQVN